MKRVAKQINSIAILLSILAMIACDASVQNDDSEAEFQSSEPLQTKGMLLNGVVAAVCYSGFRSGQYPDRGEGGINPSFGEIVEDLEILNKQTPFRLFRLYDSGENSRMVLEVIRQFDLDFKVMLGIWLRAEISSHETCDWLTEPIPQEVLYQNKKRNRSEIEKGIQLADKYRDIVVAVNVGNESLVDWNDHLVSKDSIMSYVGRVQSAIEQPVTVAENYKWWAEQGRELAAVVDFVALHTYPIWEGRDIDEGMSFTIENVNEVVMALPKTQIVITEAGWATIASEFGERASQEKQKQYCKELLEWANFNNITTFLFEAFDEDWKGNPENPFGAEKNWGLFTVDRTPKSVIDLFSQLKSE